MSAKNYLKLLLLLAVIFFAAWVFFKLNLLNNFNLDRVRSYIDSYGNYSAIVYIVIFSFRTLFVVFPYSIMLVLSGSIFGGVYGFIYSMISIFISASLAFYISRFAGSDIIRKFSGKKVKQLSLKIEKHGFKVIFLMRVTTVFPFDIVNYAAGLTKISYKDFITGTLLGIIPETFSLTYLGDHLGNPFSKGFFLAILFVVISICTPFMYNKLKKIYKTGQTDN